MGDCIVVSQISRGDSGTSLGYPPYYLAVLPARKFFLICSLKCACGTAPRRSSGSRPRPQRVYSSEGMEPITGFSFKTAEAERIEDPRWSRAEGRLEVRNEVEEDLTGNGHSWAFCLFTELKNKLTRPENEC